jgi:hypothetical protein
MVGGEDGSGLIGEFKRDGTKIKESITFSSSFRFSLRFFLRLAISARRIACSSAVRAFLAVALSRMM